MKIAILYICTGHYKVFWDEFYTSAEQYFIPGAAKTYFVFTDAKDLPYQDAPNVQVREQELLSWPYATLMRFHIFSRIREELQHFDYIFFFNANAKFLRTITAEEFLPGPQDDGLTVVLSPGFHATPPEALPYEKHQKRSTAYMPKAYRKIYVQGGVNGGMAAAYLQMIETLREHVQRDLDNGIIAIWHDESHLNRYIADKHPRLLSPSYIFPEDRPDLPFEPIILIRDKKPYGGNSLMRKDMTDRKLSLWQRILRRLKNL